MLLTDDVFRDSDVYVAGYATPYLGNTMNLNEVVLNLKNRLVSDQVFSKHSEVVFVCHSLGGLVVQELLLTFQPYSRQVPFIYFFSTPQTGAQIANVAKVFSSDPLLRALTPGDDNDYLQNIENQWKAAQFHIHRYCAYEKKKYKGVLVVDRLSGTRNCDDPPIPINEDHSGIVKPSSKEHDSYIALRNAFIQSPIATISPASRSSIRGVILADELGGSPVGEVKVNAVGADHPTETRDDGVFRLEFSYKQPGESIQIVVDKPGYVVVNWFDLKVTLPKKPDAQLLTLIICKEEEHEERARHFYRLKSDETIDATYKRRVQELEEKNQNTEASMANLRDERDKARAAAEKASNELARLTLTGTTDLFEQAISLFSKGMVSEALHILDDHALENSMDAAKQKKFDAEKALNAAIQNYLLKARLLTTQFEFGEAESVYRSAVKQAPESAQVHFALATFDLTLNRLDEARAHYLLALKLAKGNGENYELGLVLTNLGLSDFLQDRIEDAREHLGEALRIRRLFSQKMPAAQVDVAFTLNILAGLEENQDRPQQAREYYNQAVEILRGMSGQDPQLAAILALTLDSLGSLNKDLHRMEESRRCYEEAIRIFSQPTIKDRVNVLPVAITLNNLGNLEKDLNHPREARRDYEQALEMCRQAKQKSGAVLPVAVTLMRQTSDSGQAEALILNDLGTLDMSENLIEDARSSFEQALKIRRQLAMNSPGTYSLDIATTLVNMGGLDQIEGRLEEARQHYDEALEMLQQFPHTSGIYLSTLASALGNLAIVDQRQNRIDDSREHFEAALKILHALADQNSDRYSLDLAMTLGNFGALRGENYELAHQRYDEALSIYKQASKVNPETSLPGEARVLNNLGSLDGNANHLDEARKYFQEALSIRRGLAEQDPEGYLPDVLDSLLKLAKLDSLQGREEEAGQYSAEAAKIREKLTADRAKPK